MTIETFRFKDAPPAPSLIEAEIVARLDRPRLLEYVEADGDEPNALSVVFRPDGVSEHVVRAVLEERGATPAFPHGPIPDIAHRPLKDAPPALLARMRDEDARRGFARFWRETRAFLRGRWGS